MSISGLENTFTKNDASDIIAPTFTWNDIQDKPQDLDLMIRRMQDLVIHARRAQRLERQDTLRTVKNLLNEVLINVLNEELPTTVETTDEEGDIRYLEVDWAEIENKPAGIDIFSRLIDNLRKKAEETPLLDRGSSLGTVKDVINEVLLDTLSATEIGE